LIEFLRLSAETVDKILVIKANLGAVLLAPAAETEETDEDEFLSVNAGVTD
jgi:hypothetical protein